MLQEMDRTSMAFSDQFVCADPSAGGEDLAVADKELSAGPKSVAEGLADRRQIAIAGRAVCPIPPAHRRLPRSA